jgi:hypothetical protein
MRRSPVQKFLYTVNTRRRTILKVALFGGAAFLLGKVFGPGIKLFESEHEVKDFKNFRVVENGEELGFYDKFGNEILVMEKDK